MKARFFYFFRQLVVLVLIGAVRGESRPGYDSSSWQSPSWQPPMHNNNNNNNNVPSAPPEAKPFRIVTTASVAAVYALLAWRAHGTLGPHPLTTALVAANLASCGMAVTHARRHKRLLKSVLGLDMTVEGLIFLHSLVRLIVPGRKDFHLSNAISSFWFLLVALTCLRSNWIAAPPPSTDHQYNDYAPHNMGARRFHASTTPSFSERPPWHHYYK